MEYILIIHFAAFKHNFLKVFDDKSFDLLLELYNFLKQNTVCTQEEFEEFYDGKMYEVLTISQLVHRLNSRDTDFNDIKDFYLFKNVII